MLGAIAGDVIGSVHERTGGKSKDFPLFAEYSRFTDDSVLTAAVAEQLLRGGNYVDLFHRYYNRFPRVGFGGAFIRWADQGIREPYNSLGNVR
jgi:ADP-ribosylglycohydrolase